MLQKRTMVKAIIMSLAALNLQCGGLRDENKSEDEETNASPKEGSVSKEESVLEDATLSEETVSLSLSEGLEALNDSLIEDAGAGSASLALAPKIEAKNRNHSAATFACEEQDNDAIVNVNRSIDRSFSHTNRRRSLSWSVKGKDVLVRTWHKDVAGVSEKIICDAKDKHAEIAIDEKMAGLSLAVAVDRSLTSEQTKTDLRKNQSFSHSRATTAKGSRNVHWVESALNSDGSTYVMQKKVASKMERELTTKNSKGRDVQLSFSISGEKEIEAVLKAEDHSLVSNEIKSGKIVAVRNGDGRIETEYFKLLSVYAEGKCELTSGRMVVRGYKLDAQKPPKVFELVIADGEYTLTDLSDAAKPKIIEDFVFAGCEVHLLPAAQ